MHTHKLVRLIKINTHLSKAKSIKPGQGKNKRKHSMASLFGKVNEPCSTDHALLIFPCSFFYEPLPRISMFLNGSKFSINSKRKSPDTEQCILKLELLLPGVVNQNVLDIVLLPTNAPGYVATIYGAG